MPTGKNYKHVRKLVSDNKFTQFVKVEIVLIWESVGEKVRYFYDTWKYMYPFMWFCAVATGRPLPVDWDEPEKVAESVRLMEVNTVLLHR